MATRIAIASGKGGTGKTTVALNLHRFLVRLGVQDVVLGDCDVEEPNAAIFFPDLRQISEVPVQQEIPVIDPSRCTYCRKCAEYCEFNAIVVIPPARFAEVNPSLCHSCGACTVACTYDAIWVKDEPIGTVTRYQLEGSALMEGRLRIGSPMQTMVIRELKRSLQDHGTVLLDAPPGTSCPVVETISDADYLVLVTEPTPFGLHDLKLMVELVRELGIPYGVIINKAGTGNREVYAYLQGEQIQLLGEVPFSREYAAAYAGGDLFSRVPAEIEGAYLGICGRIMQHVNPS